MQATNNGRRSFVLNSIVYATEYDAVLSYRYCKFSTCIQLYYDFQFCATVGPTLQELIRRYEIANVNLLTTISHTRRPSSKYRKRDKPTSFNK